MEENHYYPFGLKHQNYNTGRRQLGKKEEILAGNLTLMPAFVLPTEDKPMAYKYKYNGKEFQDELGLNFYDYGARNYDPAVGRFFNMDRFSEAFYPLSNYQYTSNNPIFFTDINGDYFVDPKGHIESLIQKTGEKQSKFGKRINELDNEIKEIESNGGDSSKLKSEHKKLLSAQAELSTMLKEIEKLGESPQAYKINELSSQENHYGSLTMSDDGKTVNVNFLATGSNRFGNLAHELKHAFQYNSGDFSMIRGGGATRNTFDIKFEIEAFTRESIFNDFNNFGLINSQFVKNKAAHYDRLISAPDEQRIHTLNKIKLKISESNRSKITPKEVVIGWEKL